MWKTHTIGEDLIKPSISAFLKTVLEKVDNAVNTMPLSNNTVGRRIDEMSDDIETQLVEIQIFLTLQMDESTLRDGEVVLLIYERYIDKGEFAEEMVFCKSLETITSPADIYGKLNNYLRVSNIPEENITS
ncbi:SCAN domain-containing protein 3 [Trichonephila clavipes]|nr:SCAN domain-containing protein 3 [Trichonephila clavipes]